MKEITKIKKYINGVREANDILERGYYLHKLQPIKLATIKEINADQLPTEKIDYLKCIYYNDGICTNIDWNI